MVEFVAGIVVASVVATFFSDIMSRTIKMIRAAQRRASINVAEVNA